MNLVIDLTDLIKWEGSNFTGIQRVVHIFSTELLKLLPETRFSVFDIDKNMFFEIKLESLDHSNYKLDQLPILRWGKEDSLLLLGATWNLPRMLEKLVAEKKEFNLKITHFIHDISPITVPHFHKKSFPPVKHAWVTKILDLCDSFLFNSNFTKKEFLGFSSLTKKNKVIYLGSDSIGRTSTKLETGPKDYCLSVGTIEPRKNHELIYLTWKLFISLGKEPPNIVIVGKTGWNSSATIQLLTKDPEISPYIQIIHNADDDKLEQLYQNCLFTIFPSFYEGWGLPISESLLYGKFCLSSSEASMPEVGKNYIDYFSPTNPRELFDKILQYTQDKNLLKMKESKISSEYKPFSWEEQSKKILNFLFKD